MLIKSEQLSVGSLIKNVMLKYLFWASYILRLCAQTCTPNRHALMFPPTAFKNSAFDGDPRFTRTLNLYSEVSKTKEKFLIKSRKYINAVYCGKGTFYDPRIA